NSTWFRLRFWLAAANSPRAPARAQKKMPATFISILQRSGGPSSRCLAPRAPGRAPCQFARGREGRVDGERGAFFYLRREGPPHARAAIGKKRSIAPAPSRRSTKKNLRWPRLHDAAGTPCRPPFLTERRGPAFLAEGAGSRGAMTKITDVHTARLLPRRESRT